MVKRSIQMFCRNDLRAEVSTDTEIAWEDVTGIQIQNELNNRFNTILKKVIGDAIEKVEPDNQTLRMMVGVEKRTNKFVIKAEFELKDNEEFLKIERKILDFYNYAPSYFANTPGVIVKPEYATTAPESSSHVYDEEVTNSLKDMAEEVLENAKSHIFLKGLEVPNPAGGVQTCRLYPTAELKEKMQEKKLQIPPKTDNVKVNSLRISTNGYAITGFSKNEGKNISVFIPEYLIQSEAQELMISPSYFCLREVLLEIQLEHGRLIARKIY